MRASESAAVAVLLLIAAVQGRPRAPEADTTLPVERRQDDGPSPTAACGTLSSLWAQQTATVTAFDNAPTVDARLARDCLESIPLHAEEALELVDDLRPYIEWQSNLAFLRNPPADYEYGAWDVLGHLNSVRQKLVAGEYAREIDFQEDLFEMTAKAHDGHFSYLPDALGRVFDFARPIGLVSYAPDPLTEPVIKVYADVEASGDAALTVARINGVAVSEYVQDVVDAASVVQDLDAAYNTMFFSLASRNVGFAEGMFLSGGRHRHIYPGDNTTVEYTNGRTMTYPNRAIIKMDMSGVTDGELYYSKFCALRAPETTQALSSLPESNVARRVGYPPAVLESQDEMVAGYYIDAEGFEDVAVLVIAAFNPPYPTVFQSTVESFIATAKSEGKTKIIIDLQMNAGGYIFLGYDVFRQFFPSQREDGFGRFRQTQQFNAMAQIVSDGVSHVDPYTSGDGEQVRWTESWWNYRYDYNESGETFENFAAKFSPRIWGSDYHTANMRWNFDRNLTTTNTTFGMGMEISGYGDRSSLTQPFESQDIILLTDGYCASTCSLFATEMKRHGNVKTVAFGGRPNSQPMQGVGGTKGAQVLLFSEVHDLVQGVLGSPALTASLEQEAELSKLTDVPVKRGVDSALNVRDQILRDNLQDGMPAQFIKELADCRLYWTLPMLRDPVEIWKAAADAAWGGSGCVAGSGFESKKSKNKKKSKKRETSVDQGGQGGRKDTRGTKKKPRRATRVISKSDLPEKLTHLNLENMRKYNQRIHL